MSQDTTHAGDDSWHVVQMGILERRLAVALPKVADGERDRKSRYFDWLIANGYATTDEDGRNPHEDIYDEDRIELFVRSVWQNLSRAVDEGRKVLESKPVPDRTFSEYDIELARAQATTHANQPSLAQSWSDLARRMEAINAESANPSLGETMFRLERSQREIVFRIRPNPDPTICNVYLEYGDRSTLDGGVHSSFVDAVIKAYHELKAF